MAILIDFNGYIHIYIWETSKTTLPKWRNHTTVRRQFKCNQGYQGYDITGCQLSWLHCVFGYLLPRYTMLDPQMALMFSIYFGTCLYAVEQYQR